MGRSVEIVAIILFGVVGLSHILQPKAWAAFFIILRRKGEAGAFTEGLLNLLLGAIIVGFHNIWSAIPVALTLVGWGLLIKGVIRFCAPKQGLRIMARVSAERPREFRVAGACSLSLPASSAMVSTSGNIDPPSTRGRNADKRRHGGNSGQFAAHPL